MTCTGAAQIVFASALIVCCVSTGKTAQADVVTDWNVIALNATTVPPNSVLQSRTLAIVHAAVYDAVASLDQSGRPYAVDLKAPAGASVDAAIAAAAHGVLMRLAPGQRLLLDEALNTALSRIAGQAKTDGIATGQKVAERMVALELPTEPTQRVAFTPKLGPGLYQLTSGPAILAQWGDVKPFVLSTMGDLNSKERPRQSALNSRAISTRSKALVRAIAQRERRIRQQPRFSGSSRRRLPWHAAARAASAAKGLSVSENARLFALLSLATANSQIVAMREKYSRPHWRPVTAIQAAADLGIATLKGDPTWEPLLNTPPHPDYPSAHAVFSGAAECRAEGLFRK